MSFDSFDDFFKKMREHIKKIWDDSFSFFDDDFFEEPEIDAEEFMKFPKSPYRTSKDKNYSYSMSYHWETGMDKPEIKIEGNAPKDVVDRFLKDVSEKFGNYLDTNNIKFEIPASVSGANLATDDSQKETEEEEWVIPITEVNMSDKDAVITMDIPGAGKDDVEFKFDKNIVTVIAKGRSKKYKKKIKLNFEPDPKSLEYFVQNGVLEFNLKKK
ncbi:MAG: Hsp20/alpha crystallin family protein [Promethearchaeota archaeon]